uniref:Histone-lysine N-methyltransferase n=1 Tax=Nannospalax galili TaxID=1026970 RepID=A0A8C6W909_NANGA
VNIKKCLHRAWWCTPLIPALRRQRQVDLCEFKASLVYIVKDMEYFLVKWKGWPDSTNTWEHLKNLKSPLLLQQFSNDKHNYLSWVKKGKAIIPKDNSNKTLRHAIAEYIVKKAKQRIKNHKGMIFVENTVDLEGPPSDFYYVNEYKPAPGISLDNKATFGCSCTNCFFEKCRPAAAGVVLAYKNQQIRIQPGMPIYECNSRCQCGPDCPNRMVQKGTHNGCEWGVKTLYVGEVITNEEAERRGPLYDNKGTTYLFDLDYESDEYDFVNHSCDPNLQVFSVFIDNLDPCLPRIALFSTRPREAGEELTFDYQMKCSGELSSDSIDLSPICRGYLN